MRSVTGLHAARSTRVSQEKTASAHKVDLSFLKRSNPRIDQILKDNPGVGKLLAQNAGAIYKPKRGEVQTTFSWPVWTHSPASAGLTKANEKDIIVVWQEVPGSKARVHLGYQSFPGEIIALHRVNLRDQGPVRPWTASDKGYIWPSMTVTASGAKGKAAKMHWAVVTIDKQGRVTGGGYPSGYSGRSFTGVHGRVDYIPLKS